MRQTRKLALMVDVLAFAGSQLGTSLQNRFYRSKAGRGLWQTNGPENTRGDELVFDYPASLRPGNSPRGEAWLARDYTLAGAAFPEAGAEVENADRAFNSAFDIPAPNPQWAASLHGFDWLHDVMAVPTHPAKQDALHHILSWTRADFILQKPPMQPAIIARRLLSWSAHLPALRPLCQRREWAHIHLSMADQARWLSLTIGQARDGIAPLEAAIGLAFAGLILANRGDILRTGMEHLRREMRRQILADGGHISRAPETLARLLADLKAIEAGLLSRNITPPSHFAETLTRMRTLLMMLRHEDGGLACFHGGGNVTAEQLRPLLDGHKASNMSFANRSGYQKLKAGKTTLLMDVGNMVSGADGVTSHAAPLAFELSHNQHRVIVNCGANKMQGPAWRLAARVPAAHSTLGFDENAHQPFLSRGLGARQLGARLICDDWRVSCRRSEDPSGMWLEAGHSLFGPTHGVRHNRRLFMDAKGEDIRGEDLLFADKNARPRLGAPFHLRFHLHPSVRASLQGAGNSVLLTTGGGQGWQFRMASEENTSLRIEDSVYMGQTGVPQRCQQISISGTLGDKDTLIRWGLRYAGRTGRRRQASS